MIRNMIRNMTVGLLAVSVSAFGQVDWINQVKNKPYIFQGPTSSQVWIDTYAMFAANTYIPSIYPDGVATATVQGHDFTGAGVANKTYNSFTVLGVSDLTTSGASVVGGWIGALCRSTNCYVTGSNILALAPPSAANTKLVGVEIDVEPSIGGSTAGGSAGMYINGFNIPIHGPAILIGGVGGGLWDNGIGLTGIATTGAGLYVNQGAGPMSTFINTTQGSFTNDAIALGNSQGILFYNTGGTPARIWNDSSNNMRFVPGTTNNAIFRDPTDSTSTGNIVGGTLELTGIAQPSCSASNPGTFWYSGHATGVKDSVAVCAADASNAYAWRTIY